MHNLHHQHAGLDTKLVEHLYWLGFHIHQTVLRSSQLMSANKLTPIMWSILPYGVDGDRLVPLGNRIHESCCHHATPAPSLSAHPLRPRQSRLSSDPLVQVHQRTSPVHDHMAAVEHKRHRGLGCRRGYSITHGCNNGKQYTKARARDTGLNWS